MIGCDHCTIVGSKCAVNFTDSTFSAEQSTIAYCTNGVVSYALSYMYVTALSLNECNFLACTDAVSLIDIDLATVVQCALINCTVGVDAVHIYDQISLYQCNFISTGYPLVATTISNLIVEQCIPSLMPLLELMLLTALPGYGSVPSPAVPTVSLLMNIAPSK